MTNIKNTSEFPVQIGNVSIRPKGTALVARWDVLQHSDNVKSLLNAEVIEVVDDEKTDAEAPAKTGSKPNGKQTSG
jgi:hypothetical protein